MAKILLVDDEPAIRALVRAALEGAGHEVIDAADGASALPMAREQRPDLAVLDIALPRVSGVEVCRRLKAERPAAPVLLLTGLAQDGGQDVAAQAGADGVLAKPFRPDELVARIEAALPQPAAPGAR
jgi:two-component system OmpR family response regulator